MLTAAQHMLEHGVEYRDLGTDRSLDATAAKPSSAYFDASTILTGVGAYPWCLSHEQNLPMRGRCMAAACATKAALGLADAAGTGAQTAVWRP